MAKVRKVTLMDRRRIERTLKRMAYQLAEDNRSEKDLILFGIEQRGYATARALGETLSDIYSEEVPVESWPSDGSNPELDIDEDKLADSYIVIVDDVIFSGQTLFGALTAIAGNYSLSELHTAVLIDRGHRKFPVQAQIKGMALSTKFDEHVSVVVDDGQILEVVLEMPK